MNVGDNGSDDDASLSGEVSQSEVQPQMQQQPVEDLPGILHIIKQQRQCGRRNPVPLEVVATSVARTIPQQREQLALLRRVAGYTSACLNAQAARPSTYAGELTLTLQQRGIKALAHDIIDELITSAFNHVSMRPSSAVVKLELATWRAGQPAALTAISRHMADGIYKEVVDELLAELAAEAATSALAAEAFGIDMLVAAVAFSAGKFDVGFSAAQAPKNHGVGGVAREAALLHKVASTKSMSILTGPDAAPSGFRPTSSFGRANTGTNRRVLQVGMQPEASGKFLYLVPRDFSALDHAFSRSASAVDDPQLPRQLQRKLSRKSSVKHTRHLYLMGLRGMLAEMRAVRPPGTPYGHTQQLKPKFAMGQGARNKVARLAISRAQPPLAACPRVWALRQGPLGLIVPGGWSSSHHMAAAHKERTFWSQVILRGYLLDLPSNSGSPTAPLVSSLVVPTALGSITCLSACPSGDLVAAGTNRGALLIWDISRNEIRQPVFQVSGSGETYKQSWWNPWQGTAEKPAITGLCWSADGFQLAALDASSNVKLWWMTSRQQASNPHGADGVPPAPELAVTVTPLNVAMSGKAPITEPDEAVFKASHESAIAAATEAAAAAASNASNRPGLLPRLGQWLGLSKEMQKAEIPSTKLDMSGRAEARVAQVESRQLPAHHWSPVFHPERTPAGTQPTLIIPQVTGDVLLLTTATAEAPVLPGPAPTAQQGSVGAALEAAVADDPAATASSVAPATGKGQLPKGAAKAVESCVNMHSMTDNCTAAAARERGVRKEGLPGSPSGVVTNASAHVHPQRTHPGAQSTDEPLPQAVLDYLMPPQVSNPSVSSQALHRCHASPVVFVDFLSDDASLISLDSSGLLALWPQHVSQRCGFGWLKPRARWQLPRMIAACRPRGGIGVFYPTAGVAKLAAPTITHSKQNSANAGWYARYVPDSQDAQDQVSLLKDPVGDFLLQARTPWLVRCLPAGSSVVLGGAVSGTGVVRQVFHRPTDASAPGGNCLVVSSYDAATGALLTRAKQRCTFNKAPVKVVGAKLTSSKRELLVVCRVTPQQDDASALAALTAMTISLSSMKARVPRIDLPDVSDGTMAPAFGLSETLVATGTEYLLADLGAGIVGVFSLATAQLVREIRLHSVRPTSLTSGQGGGLGTVLASLQWVQLSGKSARKHVEATAETTNPMNYRQRTLLAAACSGGQHVVLIDLDIGTAAQQVKAVQEAQNDGQDFVPAVPTSDKVRSQQQPQQQQVNKWQNQQNQRQPTVLGQNKQRQQQPESHSSTNKPIQKPSSTGQRQVVDGATEQQAVIRGVSGKRSLVRFDESRN